MRDEYKHRIARELWQLIILIGIGLGIGVIVALIRISNGCKDIPEIIGIPFIMLLWVIAFWYFIRLIVYLAKQTYKGIIWVKKWKEPIK